ncbi:MAG: RNA-binding S4 domain-containing protein [Bacteroidetes bacterium]|jgi:ribosome-associated protein|nr:RNA-binding S4 domain-containing protein [Bacteroidota bacterium]
MQHLTFELKSDSIELYKLLKVLQMAHSGGMSKLLIEQGHVSVNHEVETRKRAKIRKDDVIHFQDLAIDIV